MWSRVVADGSLRSGVPRLARSCDPVSTRVRGVEVVRVQPGESGVSFHVVGELELELEEVRQGAGGVQ